VGTVCSACGSTTLPARVHAGDIALLCVATHKATRILSKDLVTSPVRAPFVQFEELTRPNEVKESPRGSGVRRAIGELLICPYCLGAWVAAGFAGATPPRRAPPASSPPSSPFTRSPTSCTTG
jgi:hypothetical protein